MLPHSLQPETNNAQPQRLVSTGVIGLVFAIALAMLFACAWLPYSLIDGTHPYWLAQNEDITVYVSGFNAFFREPWHWPLWRIDSLNYPEGTLTTFVDAIPFYAALLKLLAPASWFPFNPYGYWIGGCLVLQAIGAWWVLREAQIHSWSALLALTVLLLAFPAWIARMGHISLMSQWIIVFALALSFRGAQRQKLAGVGWCALLWVAFFTNVYLFAIAALVFSANVLDNLRPQRWKAALLWPIVIGILLVGSALCTMWPIPGSTGAPDVGFGIYSMNLLSPITGSRFFDLPAHNAEQAFEGYNYLGLGGLLLVFTAGVLIISKRRSTKPSLSSKQFTLWLVLALATFYALSNEIYLGTDLIAQWTVPEWVLPITGQLRASGRFFWLVGYALIIFSVITIVRRLARLAAVSILITATCLQVVDLWPQLHQLRDIQPKAGAEVINFEAWDRAFSNQTQTIYFFPKFKCGRKTDLFVTLLPVMRYASERQLNINTGYIARHNPTCERTAEEIANSNPATSAFVFATQEYGPERIREMLPADWQVECETQDFATICHRVNSVTPR